MTCNTWPGVGYQTLMKASEVPTWPNFTTNALNSLGLRVVPSAAGNLTAVRFLKGLSEAGTDKRVRVIDWKTGAEYASVASIADAACAGGQWVSVALRPPIKTAVGTEYLVVLDNVMFFARSDNFLPRTSGALTSTGSSSGLGQAIPWDVFWQASSYWLDGA